MLVGGAGGVLGCMRAHGGHGRQRLLRHCIGLRQLVLHRLGQLPAQGADRLSSQDMRRICSRGPGTILHMSGRASCPLLSLFDTACVCVDYAKASSLPPQAKARVHNTAGRAKYVPHQTCVLGATPSAFRLQRACVSGIARHRPLVQRCPCNHQLGSLKTCLMTDGMAAAHT